MKEFVAIIILACACSGSCNTFAQQNPYNEVSIASPTAAALGKVADVPVNYHTGIPQLSIPLYTITEGRLKLPVTLNYFAGGLKVLEPASWVGAGWSLSAGGVITRTVQGAPDERLTSSVYNQTHGHLSDSGYNNYNWIPTGQPPVSAPSWAPFREQQDLVRFADGTKDGEPDIFSFNVAGYSGKFYFHDDGTAVMLPEQDIKVEYDYQPGFGNSIASFVLTTSGGTRFFFGNTDAVDIDPVEKTNPFTGDAGLANGSVISSWFLNKIISYDGLSSIQLTYAAENYSCFTTSMFPVRPDNTLPKIVTGLPPVVSPGYKLVRNIINGVRLASIRFSNGKLDFIPQSTPRLDLNGTTPSIVDDVNLEARALAAIQLSDNTGNVCRKFSFSYTYFEDNISGSPMGTAMIGSDRRRLRLNTIQEMSCDGTQAIPPHQFDYFDELVPRRLSFAQDHWGFINEALTNSGLIPTYTINRFTVIPGANREPHWPAMRGGTLRRITFPTGGHTEFEFEPNDTWVNYTGNSWEHRFSITAGFDGNASPVIVEQTLTASTYRISFASMIGGSQAILRIINASNAEVKGFVLEPGQQLSEMIQLPAGVYRIQLQKLKAISGKGTEARFEEAVNIPIQGNTLVGGLRVRKMTTHDGVSVTNDMVTSFEYATGGRSTGILYGRPTYVYQVRNNVLREVGYLGGPTCSVQGCVGCDGYAAVFYLKSPSGIRPMEASQGNHIGYNEVKVARSGRGYTVYRYYGSEKWDGNTGDIAVRSIDNLSQCDGSLASYPFEPLPYEFKRGELKYEGSFDQSGNCVKEVNYYPVFTENIRSTPAIRVAAYPNSMGEPSALPTYFFMKTARKTELKTVEKQFGMAGGVLENICYTYYGSSFHNQITRTTSQCSTGELLENRLKYAADFRLATCDALPDCEQAYLTAANNKIIQYISRKNQCPDHACRWWAWQTYYRDLANARKEYLSCRRSYLTGTGSFNNCFSNRLTAAEETLRPVLELQRIHHNPVIESSNWRNGRLLQAVYNRFEQAATGSPQLYLAQTFVVPVAVAQPVFTASFISGNALVKDNRYRPETNFKYALGNLVEMAARSGPVVSFLWGYNNRLPVARATGVSYSVLKAAYDAVNGDLTLLRRSVALEKALLQSFSHQPLFGMTRETNVSGKDSFFEYDKLGRLTITRDHDRNILSRICYGFRNQQSTCGQFSNAEHSGTYKRNNCSTGSIGSNYVYIIPAARYFSSISQVDADNMAKADLLANGQAMANRLGTCTVSLQTVSGSNTSSSAFAIVFTNSATRAVFTLRLSPTGMTSAIIGLVPPGVYTVNISTSDPIVSRTFRVNTVTQIGGNDVRFSNVSVTNSVVLSIN